MKGLSLSGAAFIAVSTIAGAGGNIAPVEPTVETQAVDLEGFYIGGAISMVDASYDGILHDGYEIIQTGNGDDTTFMLQAGYEFNEYIAIEGRYWFESSMKMDGDSSGSPFTATWSEKGDFSAWGIYLKPMYPVTEAVDIYALVGYGHTTFDVVPYLGSYNPITSKMTDEDGLQWGVGASYSVNENLSVFVDYVQLCSNAKASDTYFSYTSNWETDIYALNFGITYKF